MNKVPVSRRTWKRVSEIPARSSAMGQIVCMRDFVAGKLSGPEFVTEWLSCRESRIVSGERVGRELEHILTQLFMDIDDRYAIDPSLRDASDMTEEELLERVRKTLDELEGLERS